ncbi:MAG: YIP1 family protein [Candidatus Micrarchaeota archaeon]
MEILNLWKEALLNPKETFARQKRNSSIGKALKHLAIALIIAAILLFLFSMFFLPIMPGISTFANPILLPFIALFFILLFEGAIWFISRGLGGRANFGQQFYLSALFLAPLWIIGMVPLINLLAFLYAIYLFWVLICDVHGLDGTRAGIALAVPVVIAISSMALSLPGTGYLVPVAPAPEGALPSMPATSIIGSPSTLPGEPSGIPTITATASVPATVPVNGPTSPYIWVSGYDGSHRTISKLLRSDGSIVGTYPVGIGPRAIAIDPSGNVWVANSGEEENNVIKLDGSTGGLLGTFPVGFDPEGIAIDGSGNVWVTNRGDDSVTKLDNSGKQIGTYGTGGRAPWGIAIDQNNDIWVANTYAPQSVSKLDGKTGELVHNTPMNAPSLVAVDSRGNVWVSSGYLFKLDNDGNIIGNESGYYAYNAGVLAIDKEDNVWAASKDAIIKLSPEGDRLGTYAAGIGATGIAVDEDGFIWVVSGAAGGVLKLSPDGALVGKYTDPNVQPYAGTISIGDMTGFALKHFVMAR